LLRGLGLAPGMIHLDAGHDYDSVSSDLRAWWPLLSPGGLLVGDDYHTDGQFPGVRQGFDDFFAGVEGARLEHHDGKCRLRKPG